ncbi:MAG TPA: BatA domain-containing protein [Bacteroidota bacterium]|nr:BatA domain-containing protein [Bacteroidota bacterium]
MTFLNPFVLFGLAAAAIPILLHLLNKRKLRTVEFSSLSFLKELQKSTMRRITLRQWLLLLLRTLFIILVVLALSRPVLRGSFAGFGSHAKTSMVLIVDDSYTMSLENQQGAYLKQAREAALRVLGMMKEGDDVLMIRLSELPGTAFEPTRDPARIRTLLQELKVSPKHRTIEDALRLASRLLRESKNFNKEVYIFTDAQQTTFLASDTAASRRTSERLFDEESKFFVLPLNDRQFENCGIEKIESRSSLLQPGRIASVEVSIRNFGLTAVSNRLASLIVDGSRVMQKTVSIAPGASVSVAFSFTPAHAGFQRCTIELKDDTFEADNRYYFSLYVPEQVHIALIADDETQTSYIRAALSALSLSGGAEGKPFLSVNEFQPGRISSSALQDADLVLACGVKEFTQSDAQMIAMAMQSGTGLLFFPGPNMDEAKYNAEFFPVFDIPVLQSSGMQTSTTPGAQQPTTRTANDAFRNRNQTTNPPPPAPQSAGGTAVGQTSFDKIDFDHTIFKGIFEPTPMKRSPQIESPAIGRQIRFSSQQPLRPIITTGTGTYFLWEKRFGRGTILGFSVPPTTEWSDFVLKPIFIPLLSQAILYIGSSVNAGVEPGVIGREVDPRTMLIPRTARHMSSTVPLHLFDPAGNETKFAATVLDAKGALALAASLAENAQEMGFYAITQGADTITVVGMNLDRAESDGKPITPDAIARVIAAYGGTATILKPDTQIDTAVLESRFGVELWKYFLFAALAIALIEMLVARERHDIAA